MDGKYKDPFELEELRDMNRDTGNLREFYGVLDEATEYEPCAKKYILRIKQMMKEVEEDIRNLGGWEEEKRQRWARLGA